MSYRQHGWCGNRVRQATLRFVSVLGCLSLLGWMCAARAAGVEVLAQGRGYTEGTIFVGDILYFVDFSSSDVLRIVANRVESVWHQKGCGPSGLLQVPQGLLVACYGGNTVVLVSLDGKVLRTIRSDAAGHLFNGPNDLAADAKGGVYFSVSGSGKEFGKIYFLAASGQVRVVAGNINYANGLVVSADGKLLYVAESSANRLLEFAIAADGSLGPQRVFVKLADILKAGRTYTPDGVRIDGRGRLFVGLYDGGGFAVINSDGMLMRQVDVAGRIMRTWPSHRMASMSTAPRRMTTLPGVTIPPPAAVSYIERPILQSNSGSRAAEH
jgi:gluconolactonase